MPTQLQLEGPELEPLLDQVRNEHGSGARIVSAEKVRIGGIGGFFARQRFELTVEVDADAPAAAAAPAVPPPASLLDLVDQVDADEHAAAVSTESPTFASLLSRIGSAMGTPSAHGTAPAPAVQERSAAPQAASDALAAIPAQRTAGRRTSVPPANQAATPVPVTGASTVAVPAPTAPQIVLRPPVPAPAPAAPVTADPAGELARLGLPEHLRPASCSGDTYPALLESLRQLPKVPRTTNRAGGVLAVVGPLPLALDVAREIARELGLPVATTVFLAAAGRGGGHVTEKQRIRDLDTATARRTGWRRRRNLTLVVVDAPLTSAGASEARAYLGALDPTATWGVVEATRKAQDVGTWTRALGGVHALALTGVEDTADPASVLELGIPVGRLGNRAATPAVWASLLTGRLAA